MEAAEGCLITRWPFPGNKFGFAMSMTHDPWEALCLHRIRKICSYYFSKIYRNSKEAFHYRNHLCNKFNSAAFTCLGQEMKTESLYLRHNTITYTKIFIMSYNIISGNVWQPPALYSDHHRKLYNCLRLDLQT